MTKKIDGLSNPKYYIYNGADNIIFPCVVKPCIGSAKKGVSFVNNLQDFKVAINYAKTSNSDEGILVEEYIEGKELSVESISFHGTHRVVQITDKISSGPPHFVELAHHQPAQLPKKLSDKIKQVIPEILTKIGYTDGASHIEIKYRVNKLYLIEVNLRGGGDEISNRLVSLSTGLDYLRAIIEVSLNTFHNMVRIGKESCSGIYFLCQQTSNLLPKFLQAKNNTWCVDVHVTNKNLSVSTSNYDRNGYLIYRSNNKINL